MNGKLAGLVVGAVVLVGAAGFMLTQGESTPVAERSGFLPGLKTDVAKVARVELSRGKDEIVLVRSGDEWTLASAGGYPAKLDGVRSLMTGLASLEVDEALTAKRERHGELGLAWPDEKGQAALVRLLDANAAPLYEIVLGEEKFSPKSQYVRRLAEDQTYRCRGGVTIDTSTRGFAETEIVSLADTELESIAYDTLVISRGEDKAWKAEPGAAPIDPVATGAAWPEEQKKAAAQTLPSWVSRLDFDDVRRRDREGATWVPDPAFSMTYFAKDVTLHIEAMKEGDDVWMRVSGTPNAKPAEAAGGDASKPAEGAKEPAEGAKEPEKAQTDWAAWSARVAAWEFKLPDWKKSAIVRIREAKPAAASPAPSGAPQLPFPLPQG